MRGKERFERKREGERRVRWRGKGEREREVKRCEREMEGKRSV